MKQHIIITILVGLSLVTGLAYAEEPATETPLTPQIADSEDSTPTPVVESDKPTPTPTEEGENHTPTVEGENPYEAKIVGRWEVEDEADLFVFEKENICYRMDEDEIRTSENGRWTATAKVLSTELKYNGKKYRTIFSYEQIDEDTFKLVITRAFIDGKAQEIEKKRDIIVKRFKD